MGDSYALIIDGDSGTMQGIGICPEDSIKVISQVDISSKRAESCAADADAAGNLIVANADGLHRKAKDAGSLKICWMAAICHSVCQTAGAVA